jgi:hypothetical protein
MRRLPSDPQIIHRKDVPHLSESLLIGIERWRFVEGDVNELAIFMNRRFKLDYKRLSVPCDEMSARVSRPANAGRRRVVIKLAEVLIREGARRGVLACVRQEKSLKPGMICRYDIIREFISADTGGCRE